jgi:nucleoside 2-deoxyribosyltransferase
MAGEKTCYIIGQIGDPDTVERKWADFVRDEIVEPAVTASGYKAPTRADDPDVDLIMPDIIKQMFGADLVIADLTDFNPNVFYELGIRHCAQKPAIHLIRTGQSPSFDLGGNKAIFVDDKHVTVKNAISDIQRRIKAVEKDPKQFYSQVQQYIKHKQLELFKESQIGKDEILFETLLELTRSIGLQTGFIRELQKELVEKPKLTYLPRLYRRPKSTLLTGFSQQELEKVPPSKPSQEDEPKQ